MSFKRSFAFLVVGGLASVVAQGCTASTGSPNDGGTVGHKEASSLVMVAMNDGGDDSGALVFDGTSGKPCTTSADCTTATGPGINVCSNTSPDVVVTNVKVQLLPTPVCTVSRVGSGGNCDPAPPSDTAGAFVHFCDGPDMPTSPGICIPGTNPPMAMLGVCLPACTFALDGSAQKGCPGKDTCAPYTVTLDANGNGVGVGFCQGSCQIDADCSALGTGYVCQTDIGFCTKTKVTRTKSVGQACAADPTKVVGNDSATGACNCVANGTTNLGYCSTACVVGGSPCANGWVCDNGLLSDVQLSNNQVLMVTADATGTPGQCMQPCSLGGADGGTSDAGSAGDGSSPLDGGPKAGDAGDAGAAVAGGACPATSTCQATSPVGPDCVP
jgi:hypothetical protein